MPIYNAWLSGDHPKTGLPLDATDESVARLAYRDKCSGLECDDASIIVQELATGSSEHRAALVAIERREAEERIDTLLQAKPQTPAERQRWATALLPEVRGENAERYLRKIARMATDIMHDIDPPSPLPESTGSERNDSIRLLRSITGQTETSPADSERKKSKKPGRKRGDRKPDVKEPEVIKAHRHRQNLEVTARAAKVFTKDGRPDVRRVQRIIRAYKAANPGHEFPAANS